MKILSACFISICLLFFGTASADDEIKVGFYSYYGIYAIEDPDGSADDYTGIQPLNAAFTYPLSNSTRVWTEVGMVDFDVDGSASNIANDVSGFRFAAAYQYRVRASRDLHFWAGAGAAVSQLDFSDRFIETNDGFLRERFDDRSETTIGAYLNLSTEWELSEKLDLGLNVSYQLALGDSISGLNAGLIVFYKFGN